MILEMAVGRGRVGRHGVCRRGVRTQQASPCKDEQRSQRAPGRLNRARRDLTHLVKTIEHENARDSDDGNECGERSTAVSRMIVRPFTPTLSADVTVEGRVEPDMACRHFRE